MLLPGKYLGVLKDVRLSQLLKNLYYAFKKVQYFTRDWCQYFLKYSGNSQYSASSLTAENPSQWQSSSGAQMRTKTPTAQTKLFASRCARYGKGWGWINRLI